MSPDQTGLDWFIRGPEIAFQPLRSHRLLKSGTLKIRRNGPDCPLSGIPDVHHQLAGATVGRERFDTRSIRPVHGDPSYRKRTRCGRERRRGGCGLSTSGKLDLNKQAEGDYRERHESKRLSSADHLFVGCGYSGDTIHGCDYEITHPDVQGCLPSD
jgi:hypothetical protein